MIEEYLCCKISQLLVNLLFYQLSILELAINKEYFAKSESKINYLK